MALAKKGSGQFSTSRAIGGRPNSTDGTKPGPGTGSDGRGMTSKGSGNITVERAVKSPPTRKPSK